MSSGVRRSEYADRVEREGHFLVGFAQCRLVEGLARIDDAARQGHLAAMASECSGPHGQHDMCALGNGKHEQQAGRIPNARRMKSLRPLAPRLRRQEVVSGAPGQGRRQRALEAVDEH